MCKPIVIDEWDNRIVFKTFAYHNALLEGQELSKDQWELSTDEAYKIYQHGVNHRPVTVFEMLMWHKSILPFGGFFRECDPVVMGAGESFNPLPSKKIPEYVNRKLLALYNELLETGAKEDPMWAIATLHFEQWRAHIWPDGNKRHCRKMTLWACGVCDLDPVVICLDDKSVYFDTLSSGNTVALAELFESRQLPYGSDLY
jgi:hypothetical protein